MAKVWGIQAISFRIISIILLCLGLGLIVSLLLFRSRPVDQKSVSKQSALETERKYKNLGIMVNKSPAPGIGESILAIDSLDELIKIARLC
jgi:hypothetical protein